MKLGPIRFDSHTFGNLLKNVSPLAGLLGGPGGIVLAGGLSAIGDKARGKKISVKNALTNASLAGGLNAVKGSSGFQNLLHGKPAMPVPAAATDTVAHGGLALPTTQNLTTTANAAVDPRTFAGKAFDAAKSVGSFALDHPNAVGGALNAVGDLSTSGSENRLRNAQALALEKQNDETEYDFQRRKEREAALSPYWGALGTAFGESYNGIAKNPYLPTGG